MQLFAFFPVFMFGLMILFNIVNGEKGGDVIILGYNGQGGGGGGDGGGGGGGGDDFGFFLP